VLAEAVLHGVVPKGSLAYIDLDPATGEPRCWAGRPSYQTSDPLDVMHELSSVTVRGHDCGVDGEVLVAQLRGGFPGGYSGGYDDEQGGGGGAGAGGGAGTEQEVLVLASGGFEEDE
jgi:hypothetical protein